MNNRNTAVDIIVPIYNGYEDLQLCIPSIKKHTDLSKHRLILINDCSPDASIAPYLDSLAQDDRILVLHNEKNLGFSGNVNKGMQLSEDRDVILLNSDTIVTAGWVEKITSCAYRAPEIGTVTPLSNSATLCSVPVMCQDNKVPEGFTVDEYAALIERCSLHRYPRITVAVGFCMFIKRCVIDDVGLFDAETFGRGYGEENDFCNRAEIAGYQHVMCDDTFIYHKGTGSFDTAEKLALVQAHDKILRERYPEMMLRNDRYCAQNPDQEIRDNIRLHTLIENQKKNILYVLHRDFRDLQGSIGGTQLHVRELTEELKKDYNVFVAARSGSRLYLTVYTDKEEAGICFEIGEPEDPAVLHNEQLQYIFGQILAVFRISVVHVHHVQGLGLAVFDAAKSRNIPIVMTVHDYYPVCPTILLLDAENHFCTAADSFLSEQERKERCDRCLKCKMHTEDSQELLRYWRTEFQTAMEGCEQIIFPSESAKQIFVNYYPSLETLCRVIPHGEDRISSKRVHRQPKGKVVKVSALKGKPDPENPDEPRLNNIKGWAYLPGIDNAKTEIYIELTDKNGNKDWFLAPKIPRPDIVDAFHAPESLMCGYHLRFHSKRLEDGKLKARIFVQHQDQIYTDGRTYHCEYRRRYGKQDHLNVAFLGGMVPQKGSGYAAELIKSQKDRINWFVYGEIGDDNVRGIRQENCFFSGKYQREELPYLLLDHAIDVVCILPIWPETFCYTVSEAWMYHIPVLCTDIGAVGERVKRTKAGWVLPSGTDTDGILQELLKISEDPEMLKQKKQITASILMKTCHEMCMEYGRLYEQLLTEHSTSQQNWSGADYDMIFQALALADPGISGKGPIAELNALRNENMSLRQLLDAMKNTIAYRAVNTVREALHL